MRAFLLSFLLLCTFALRAQNATQFTTWGDNAMRLNDPYGASRFYNEALGLEPGLLELQWKYAEACRTSNQYREAADHYNKVFRKDQGRRYPEALRWLGEMQLCTGAYPEAEKTWAKVKQKERDKGSVIAQRADHALAGCKLALVPANDSVVVEHLQEPINTVDSEFGARIGPDSLLYFTSLRGEVDADGEVIDTLNYRAGIMRTTVDGSQKDPEWLDPARPVNEANSAWSLDGRWQYFTRCVPGAPCIIHVLAADAQDRNAAVPLKGIGTDVMSTQPMVAYVAGRQTLFFTSDRAGGKGGLDLWQAPLDDDGIGAPQALVTLNTPGNEVTPYFDAVRGKLLFASDFLPGLGGYDLFTSARGTDGTYGAPQHLEQPFNSPANDLYPTFDAHTMSGWFTSNRVGSFADKGETCCNDLYRFRYPGFRPPPPVPVDTPDVPVPVRITSLREKLPIRLYFHNDEPDPRSWETTTSSDYEQTYIAYKALVPDYTAAWKDRPEGTRAIDDFFTQQVDHGFAQLNDFIALLEQALKEGQRIELQVRGFASPLAKSDYNSNLSLRRIESMVNYLRRVDNGILVPYLDRTAENGGRLTIVKQPFGKSRADALVSDRLDDLRNSVYGVGASLERRIEIEQVLLGE
ncbi:MAG TPA: hypothetical protein VGE21_01365 [Flavobacteriales bacterium]